MDTVAVLCVFVESTALLTHSNVQNDIHIYLEQKQKLHNDNFASAQTCTFINVRGGAELAII